ncbi:protein-disulfide reductase DsbD [Agitococcus lubricus]|uniref:Thiol:disulfide interchange protein DsbD n=1 Tax=Agitococcus lubricus TaxID=1077255 RepID=A0A2T5J1Y2_9GAMM|nr:protein-disulfide reductase DsbD [Agitococcus lubricus]PTQ90450.1 thiol:disulfide interchange protein DsbD [Agitococcus lubricus]
MKRFFWLMWLVIWSAVVQAAVPSFDDIPAEEEYLPVEQAFKPIISTNAGQVHVGFTIADGYYLYKKRVFVIEQGTEPAIVTGEPQFNATAQIKNDPNFGRVEIFHHAVAVDLPVYAKQRTQLGQDVAVTLSYQGCSEQGLCYPPQKIHTQLRLTQLAPTTVVNKTDVQPIRISDKVVTTAPKAPQDANGLASFLANSSLWLVLATFLVLGIGLSFTPCVLPMVPILSGIIAGQGQGLSAKRGFLLSLSYVIGMATTYAIAGMLVGYFGASANLSTWMQSPVVLSVFAAIFVLLALAMFGFYELQLPAFIQDRLTHLNQKQQGGTYVGVLLMGILSALVVSPCVSAPLAGALLYISSTGDMFLGGAALLALGLGMGTPLLLIGLGGGSLIPKAGQWMVIVKSVFGVLLLMVAIWLLSRFLAGVVTLVLWGFLLIVCGILMGALDHTQTGWPRFWKGLGVGLLVWGVLLLVGAANGQSNPLQPLQFSMSNGQANPESSEVNFRKVTTTQELNLALAEAKQQGKTALLDFYADWCIACVEMAHDTFSSPKVAQALSSVMLIQADITQNDANSQALLTHFDLFGPPSVLFFDAQGQELKTMRIMGSMGAEDFIDHLKPLAATH